MRNKGACSVAKVCGTKWSELSAAERNKEWEKGIRNKEKGKRNECVVAITLVALYFLPDFPLARLTAWP